jgi:regulation of enolase protein 1 (concanavalin A-like superfamily)
MSNINLQIILAIAGSVALLVGLFGGGVKAKEIEVPKIPTGSRVLSSLVGAVLIWTSIQLPNYLSGTDVLTATPHPAIAPTALPIATDQPSPHYAPTEIPIKDPPNTPTDLPINTPLPTATVMPTPTKPVPEIVRFTLPDDPSRLSTVFNWQQGNSAVNSYNLSADPNALTLIADGRTGQWATEDTEPVISHPIQGNFEAQVKITYSPMWGHELAAIGIRSAQDHNTWLRLGAVYAVFSQESGLEQRIVLDIDDHGVGNKMRTVPYSANAVYLKINRQGAAFDFYYSSDGSDWLALQTGYIADIPANAELFLTIGSWGDGGVSGTFSDFQLLSK